MCNDLADYARMGQQPSGLCLASLQGPHLTNNFWTTTLVSSQYPLGLILSYSVVTRIPFISSMSTLSPKSWAHSHFIISTLLPQFPTIYPFISSNLFSSIPITNHYHFTILPWTSDIVSMQHTHVQFIPYDCLCFLLYSSSRLQ